MRLLLDTHALLWWEAGSDRIGARARTAIRDSEAVYVSAVSAWEMEIKRALGKLTFAGDADDMIRANGFVELPLQVRHATALRSLGRYHRDPFDRIIVVQAIVEECTLVTADRELGAYGVNIIDARS